MIIETVSAIAGIVGTIVAIVVAKRSRQFATARFEFTMGSSVRHGGNYFPRHEARIPVAVIAYGTAATDADHYLCLPFVLRNTGKVSIQNLKVLLQYPRRNAISDFSELEAFGKNIKAKGIKERDVDLDSTLAHVSYDISVLRPADYIGFADPVFFPAPKKGRMIDLGLRRTVAVEQELQKIETLQQAFALAVFVRAENSDPMSFFVPIFWFKSESIKQLIDDTNRAITALWEGDRPAPGSFLNLPWKRWIELRSAEMIYPKLLKAQNRNGARVAIEIPDEADLARAVAPLPSWILSVVGP